MKAAQKAQVIEVQDSKWKSPIDVSNYNRSPYLTNSEKEELTIVLNKKSTWFKKSYLILDRLLKPLHNCLDYIKANKTDRVKTVRLIFLEMEKRQTSYWAWSSEEWLEVFNSNLLPQKYSRTFAVLIAHFLVDNFEYLPSKINHHKNLAIKIFGENIVKNNIDILCKEYTSLGYGKELTKSMIPNTFCFILLTNRSPLIRDITREVLNKCRKNTNSEIVSMNIVQISRVLTNLEIIPKPLEIVSKYRKKTPDTIEGIAPEWVEWCQRWLNTSTLKSRKSVYYEMLKIGRWLAKNYPEVVSPEQWNRDIAINFIASVDKWTIGQWAGETKKKTNIYRFGEPLTPRGKSHYIQAIRQLIKDCQEWEWIPRKFSPLRALATPRSIRSLIKPKPRVIADDIWAKLLWAGLNLEEEDLLNSEFNKAHNIPILCKKAGIPNKDAIGRITSHRARSTIATQLSTAKDPMTLFELKEWLGHTNVASTINYAKVTPTKLAKSYQDAEYFKRNLRTVEVLIDQDAITTGAAKDGEPWKYYDLGHGLCTYDFFSQCKHRMACAGCGFYIPKGSSKAQIIEAKGNLERMLQEIPLTEDEEFAVTEGIEALTKLKAKLADVPTPSGQTPRQLEEERNNA